MNVVIQDSDNHKSEAELINLYLIDRSELYLNQVVGAWNVGHLSAEQANTLMRRPIPVCASWDEAYDTASSMFETLLDTLLSNGVTAKTPRTEDN
jgi:hypothetical protein